MSSNRFDNVWRLLKEGSLEIDESIQEDLLCTICKGIMIKACNGPCGCRYCYDCISNYLDGNEKQCPGNSKDCKDDTINIDRNIQIDQPINNKISRRVVKCPEKSCKYKDELRFIEDHREKCKESLVNCPYSNIGCNEYPLIPDAMKDHLIVEDYSHAKLMMDSINNFKNEMELLKKEAIELKQENNNLNLEISSSNINNNNIKTMYFQQMENNEKINKSKFVEIIETISALKNEIINLNKEIKIVKIKENSKTEIILQIQREENEHKSTIKKLTDDIEKLKKENQLLVKQKEINTNNYDNQRENIVQLERNEKSNPSKFEKEDRKIETFTNDKTKLQIDIDHLRINGDKPNTTIVDLQMKLDNKILITEQFKQKTEEFIEEMENENKSQTDENGSDNSILYELRNPCSSNNVEGYYMNDNGYVWIINNWSQKRTNAINEVNTIIQRRDLFSHENGYKMGLCLYPDGKGFAKSDCLSIFMFIMKGPNDDNLQWPFKHDVTISLINQHTRQPYKSKTSKYKNCTNNDVWEKPISERNASKGFWNFMKLADLNKNYALCSNDRIMIKCLVRLL